jgi:hypothetical protein
MCHGATLGAITQPPAPTAFVQFRAEPHAQIESNRPSILLWLRRPANAALWMAAASVYSPHGRPPNRVKDSFLSSVRPVVAALIPIRV